MSDPDDPLDAILSELRGLRTEVTAIGEMVKAVVHTQNEHGGTLVHMKEAMATIANEVAGLGQFRQHVLEQAGRTSSSPRGHLHSVPIGNGNGE